MPNLKTLTVRYLRDLARKHLGRGHSKLKTKEELLAALRKFVPGLSPDAETGHVAQTTPAEVVRFERGSGQAARAEAAAPGGNGQGGNGHASHGYGGNGHGGNGHGQAIEAPASAGTPITAAQTELGSEASGGSGGGSSGGMPPRPPAQAEPLIEGFFVARIQGEAEARRHHLTEDQAGPPLEAGSPLHHAERLDDIPLNYEDDRVVLCARDPHTAWVYWDFHPGTRHAAFDGLASPRAVLQVIEDGHPVRAIDVALEARAFYINGLQGGRTYAIEVRAVGQDGQSRQLGPTSNPVTLPPEGVSGDQTVRFMRIPFGVPLSRIKDGLRSGRVSVETPERPPEPLFITHYRWVPLPNSGSWQLQQWQEEIPQELAPPPGPGSLPTPLELGPWPVGGSSSWTLQSSWQSPWWSSSTSSRFGGSSRT